MLGRISRGQPPKRVLALFAVLGLIFTITLLNSHSLPLSENYKEKALHRLCGPTLDKDRNGDAWASKAHLSGNDLTHSMYSAGSKDSWSDDPEREPHWDEDDLEPAWEYEKSAKMVATPDIIKGNASLHFWGKSRFLMASVDF